MSTSGVVSWVSPTVLHITSCVSAGGRVRAVRTHALRWPAPVTCSIVTRVCTEPCHMCGGRVITPERPLSLSTT